MLGRGEAKRNKISMEVSKAVALPPKDVLKSNASHVASIKRWLPNAKAKHEKREATLVGYSGRVDCQNT